jgi:hypothetical protein
MLDIPCGDLNWIQHVDLGATHYIGADIVESMIAVNRTRHASPTREFRVLDVTDDELPQVDLIFCRDCKVLARIVQSRSTYLLTTIFPTRTRNYNIPTGKWRPLNLCAAPFDLPRPALIVHEGDSAPTPATRASACGRSRTSGDSGSEGWAGAIVGEPRRNRNSGGDQPQIGSGPIGPRGCASLKAK